MPEPLKSNVSLAYNTYIKNPDDLSDEDIEITAKVVDEHKNEAKFINNLLPEELLNKLSK
mgnify:CR=1 FL=1